MQSSVIEERISKLLGDAEMEITGAECDFSIVVISEKFADLSTMKRQQLILGAFTDELASGALHALSIKAYTLDEWNQRQTHLVQIAL